MKLMVAVWGAFLTLATTTAALAADGVEERRTMASSGNVALGGYASLSRDSANNDAAKTSVFGVTVSPLLDVFVADRVSIGAGLTFLAFRGSSDQGTEHGEARTMIVRPTFRLGWYIPLGDRVGFWPIAQAGYGYARSTNTNNEGTQTSEARSTAIGLGRRRRSVGIARLVPPRLRRMGVVPSQRTSWTRTTLVVPFTFSGAP